MHPSVELPPIQNAIPQQQHQLPPFHSPRPRELLPSVMAHSPPDRATTLPPIQRRESWHRKDKQSRPRKSSITQNNRKPKHDKSRSKDFSRRLSIEGRKAFSAEPPALSAAAMGKRWEDLVEAAASATEADSDRDLTPVRSLTWHGFSERDVLTLNRYLNLPHPLRGPLYLRFPPLCQGTTSHTKHRLLLTRLHHRHLHL